MLKAAAIAHRNTGAPVMVHLNPWAQHGCRILARNYRAGRHEIDLIAEERATGTIVFAEVKTRTEGGYGRPMDAVDRNKQRFLRLAAQTWIQTHGMEERSARFDVIEVFLPGDRVNRIENAF